MPEEEKRILYLDMIRESYGHKKTFYTQETEIIINNISSDILKSEYLKLIDSKMENDYVIGGSILYKKYDSLKILFV